MTLAEQVHQLQVIVRGLENKVRRLEDAQPINKGKQSPIPCFDGRGI